MVYADNYLPNGRKGDWFKAGYLRFHADEIIICRINNVLEFGATNDGQDRNDNNKKSILEALNDTCHTGFTLIFFPEGTYRISSEIIINSRSRIIIRGEGSEKTKLEFYLNNDDDKNGIFIKTSSHIGVENLFVTRLDSSNFGKNFLIQATDCWLSGIESKQAVSSHIFIHSGKNIEIRGCYIHHAWNYGVGGHGYGIDIGKESSHCLIEDNVFRHLRHAIILSNGPYSNVIGYNYSKDPFTTEKYFGISDWPADLCLHGHPDKDLPGPSKNLFEGNICAFIHADNTWEENGPYNTFLRNRATYYGLKIGRKSNKQNIIANEVDDSDGRLFDIAWNAFSIQSKDNYVTGNTNLDSKTKKYPSPSQYSSDLSLYFDPDSLPVFLKSIRYWPSIGVVDSNRMGGGTIPAKKRWDSDKVLTVFHPEHTFMPSGKQ